MECDIFITHIHVYDNMIYHYLFIDNRIEDVAENEIDVEEEEGFLDSIFGDGAQSRIAERVTDW